MKVTISDKFTVSEWRTTVLELYALKGPWPTEGEPADWIKDNKVAYCQGDDETIVIFTPTYKIIWWKLKAWGSDIWGFIQNLWLTYTPWGRAKMREVDAWWASLPVVHCEEGDDDLKLDAH